MPSRAPSRKKIRNPMPNDQSPALSFAPAFSALVVGAIAMGVSPIFVRFAEVGPFASAFWRAGLAVPILLIWALLEAQRSKKSGRQDRGIASVFRVDGPILLAGLFFAGDLFFWHLSILNTTIANATLLACLAPVWVLLLSGTLIGETVSRKAYIGLVLCLIGTATLIGSSFAFAPERLLGDLYGFATSIFFGLYFLAVRVARRKHQAGAVTFMSTSVTALVLLAITLLSGQGFLPQTIYGLSALLALGWVSHTFGQGLLAVALGALSAAFSSLVIFIEALAAALLAWLIFSENLTALQGAGGLLILYGVWVARPQKEKK